MKELTGNRLFVKMSLATFASQYGTTVGNTAFAFYLRYRRLSSGGSRPSSRRMEDPFSAEAAPSFPFPGKCCRRGSSFAF